METLIAYCGLNCAKCEAYKATRADDKEWKARVASRWQVEYHLSPIEPDRITCEGCRIANGHTFIFFSECPVRNCGLERGVETCAHCDDFDTCKVLNEFFQSTPQANVYLEEIRRLL